MYDAVYLISSRGRVLLSRSYGTREVPASHVAALAQSLFVRLYIQSAPPVVCIGDGRDKTTFIYVSAGAEDTVLDSEYAAASNVGLDATLRCTDAALRHRGVGGLVAAVACRRNPNAALAVVMLRRLLQLLQACASRAAPSTSLGALCLRKTAAGGGPLLSEAFILQSSDLVYEILDEAIDRGVPQTSDPKVLLLFAEAAANLRSTGGASAAAANSSEGGVKLAAQATGVAAWRRQGIRYRRNQLSIEVVEKLHILIAQNGTVLRQEAEGKVLLRSFLSGMPECKLITNEVLPQSDRQHLADDTQIQAITNAPLKGAAAQAAKTHTATGPPSPAAAPAAASSSAASTSAPAAAPAAAPGAPGSSVVAQRVITEGAEGPLPVGAKERVKLSGCRYHPCVRVAQHTAERMILFTPPDGECELMSYRCKDDVAVPIKVCPFFYEKKKGQFEYLVFLKALYSGNLTARDIEVVVPTPPEVSVVCVLQSSWGKSKYDSSQLAVVWKLARFPGGCEYVLRFLLEVSKPPSPVRGPLRLSFSLPGLTASGLCIRQLRVVEKSNYSVSKSIRYLTESGQYEHRL